MCCIVLFPTRVSQDCHRFLSGKAGQLFSVKCLPLLQQASNFMLIYSNEI